ncbi:methyltransferase family protein [Bittarella massiliensis (ex Durand et al. 2017)]|uniref:methyltransferase family protein n=1 Tax=Bittarella massiliensis (ex Durand et al. 2017) TaxID=1720313 RepID=UPI00073F27C6|nr:methyltransferase [Bittarella massiliensis (ex Durand et al. 2017)]
MGALLLVPFFLLRFGLLAVLDRGAVGRAAHFAPLPPGERGAYWVYQLANVGILLDILFLKVETAPPGLFWAGVALYAGGMALLAASVAAFATPAADGFCQRGVYRLSRNPMYLAYFLIFVGFAALGRSPLLLGLTAVFQVSAHWIIRAEERWCDQRFGEAYAQYARRVRRYL